MIVQIFGSCISDSAFQDSIEKIPVHDLKTERNLNISAAQMDTVD